MRYGRDDGQWAMGSCTSWVRGRILAVGGAGAGQHTSKNCGQREADPSRSYVRYAAAPVSPSAPYAPPRQRAQLRCNTWAHVTLTSRAPLIMIHHFHLILICLCSHSPLVHAALSHRYTFSLRCINNSISIMWTWCMIYNICI